MICFLLFLKFPVYFILLFTVTFQKQTWREGWVLECSSYNVTSINLGKVSTGCNRKEPAGRVCVLCVFNNFDGVEEREENKW